MMNKLLLLAGIFLFFTSCDKITDERVWVYMTPMQCLSTSWEKDWADANNDDWEKWNAMDEEEISKIIVDYFEKNDIEVHSVEKIHYTGAVCAACEICRRTYHYRFYINESDVGQMLEWGFIQE